MALRRNAKIDLLREVPLFARCSRAELAQVAGIADEIDLPEGQELTREGERGREFFVLLEGTADVSRRGRKINALGPGDFLGEIALVTKMPRTATVTTSSPTRALVITERDFASLMRRSPQISQGVIEALAERLGPKLS